MQELDLLLDSCRSEFTKNQYACFMEKYFQYVGKHDIFYGNNPRLIETKIIEYVNLLKKEGLSSSGILNYITPVKSFYAINDITLNVKKLGKFLPENRRARQDRAYTHSEIGKMLEIADERMRVVILILSSTGMRVGALPSLKIKNLQNYQIAGIYENTSDEYFTFITPECKKSIDSYLDMRSRYGEKLKDESYLIREQFDIRNPGKPKPFKRANIQYKIYDLCRRAGIDKTNVSVVHGFRKFFTTQLINSKINSEIREMLLGHKIGLASAYYRPTEQDMYQEYEKAIDLLTINEENRLKMKIQKLEVEKSRIDKLEENFKILQKRLT